MTLKREIAVMSLIKFVNDFILGIASWVFVRLPIKIRMRIVIYVNNVLLYFSTKS